MAQIKRKDVESVERKLHGFAQTLPEQEQEVLNWLLARASSTPASGALSDDALESVAGGQDLARSLGFTPDEESITVSWSKSFDQN